MNTHEKTIEKLKGCKFTAHNIKLEDDLTTFSINQKNDNGSAVITDIFGLDENSVPVISNMPTFVSISKMLTLIGKHEKRKELSIADLGCLEGGYSVEFARQGYKKVLGIEGRESNYNKCNIIADYFNYNNLKFDLNDVKNISNYNQTFDIILCLGLLYHIDSPIEFLQKLNNSMSNDGVMFLETHYAPSNIAEHRQFFLPNVYPNRTLDEISYNNISYKGCWWHEYAPSTPENKRHPWSAVSNNKSFVPTLQDLLKSLYNTGFKIVYTINEQDTNGIQKKLFRILLACFKDSGKFNS